MVVSGGGGSVSIGRGDVGGVGNVVHWVLLVCLVVVVVVSPGAEVVVGVKTDSRDHDLHFHIFMLGKVGVALVKCRP